MDDDTLPELPVLFLFPYLYGDFLALVAGVLLGTCNEVYPIVYWYVGIFGGGLSSISFVLGI